jgi:hypothetical protein
LKKRGSVRRFHRMNMWRRTLLSSLLSWWILKRRCEEETLRIDHVVDFEE